MSHFPIWFHSDHLSFSFASVLGHSGWNILKFAFLLTVSQKAHRTSLSSFLLESRITSCVLIILHHNNTKSCAEHVQRNKPMLFLGVCQASTDFCTLFWFTIPGRSKHLILHNIKILVFPCYCKRVCINTQAIYHF